MISASPLTSLLQAKDRLRTIKGQSRRHKVKSVQGFLFDKVSDRETQRGKIGQQEGQFKRR